MTIMIIIEHSDHFLNIISNNDHSAVRQRRLHYFVSSSHSPSTIQRLGQEQFGKVCSCLGLFRHLSHMQFVCYHILLTLMDSRLATMHSLAASVLVHQTTRRVRVRWWWLQSSAQATSIRKAVNDIHSSLSLNCFVQFYNCNFKV